MTGIEVLIDMHPDLLRVYRTSATARAAIDYGISAGLTVQEVLVAALVAVDDAREAQTQAHIRALERECHPFAKL